MNIAKTLIRAAFITHKRCPACRKIFKIADFYKDQTAARWQRICKNCIQEVAPGSKHPLNLKIAPGSRPLSKNKGSKLSPVSKTPESCW